MTSEEAKQRIADLLARFQAFTPGHVKRYNEENTKKDFILPLFEALGWDVYSSREVAAEEKASAGRVDYAFKLHGVPKLYLEAKPLGADLKNLDWIKKAITYAYNKGVTWAVLTNFASLQVFYALGEKAQTPLRFPNLICKDYLTDFDKLWLLSREAVEQNLLETEAAKLGVLPPKVPVEKRLYSQLRAWREELFTQLHHHNPELTFGQIDEVIQRLFNRLIFIRTCEDRGIEERMLLSALHQWRDRGRKGELIEELWRLFRYFDGYYDSDLFLLHITDQVFIEGPTLERIIEGLYDLPGGLASYDFSIIDADVLGAVYEQYLGHVAQAARQRADEAQRRMALGLPGDTVFELTAKRQKRKEQGIYYTPKWVVDYIVEQTVGRFLRERSHNEIMNMRILDPACGSGSFLIRAYDALLSYHANVRNKSVVELDQYERLPVLTNNVFGVDLDGQAVEIARLNLLIRSLARRETLPSLAQNIRQGNSLISGTEEELRLYFGDAWREKKPFTWEQEFKDIMAAGGFDVVIGNPPYGAEFDANDRKYVEAFYPYSKTNKNSAMVFIERALSLTKEDGYFSFIIPKSLAFSQKWASGRKLILDNLGVACDATKAFKEVLLEQMVIVVSKKFSKQPSFEVVSLDKEAEKRWAPIPKQVSNLIDSLPLGVTEKEFAIFQRVTSPKLFMRDITKSARGLPLQKHVSKSKDGIPIYRGDHIARYTLLETSETLPEAVLAGAKQKVSSLHQPKILSQNIVAHVQHPSDHIILMSVFDKDGVLTLDTVENTVLTDKRFAYGFVTGLLNSKFLSWYAYRFIFSKAIRTIHFEDYHLGKFPVPRIDFDDQADKKMHDDLVALVERMLELHKRLAPIRTTPCQERDDLLREIERADKDIDNLVYDLYGLTEEERAIVEGTKP